MSIVKVFVIGKEALKMRNLDRQFRRELQLLKRQFLQESELPFGDVLSEQMVAKAIVDNEVDWLDRIYSPLVTLWVFLTQVLSADHSCRAAVARLIAHRVSQRQPPCSAETGAYCQARKRLPEGFFSDVARQAGRTLENEVKSEWLWKGRRVYVYDGSMVSMPDTPANQREYPQNVAQKPGIGFPIARIAVIFSLACGAVMDLGICRYAGKGQSELGMLRSLWSIFRAGDVLLADRLMSSWAEMVMLKQRGVDCVCRFSSHRAADFRLGRRLGKGDHLVKWMKPTMLHSVDLQTYKSLPDFLVIRETLVHTEQPGFRTKSLIVATTLLDDEEVTACDLALLYRARWNAELDLRSLKQTLQMDVLRCKSPELVRKELWMHVLTYNLIRTIIAQAAAKHALEPRSISFKGTLQTLEAFQPVIALQGEHDAELRQRLYEQLLDAVATHRVAQRPDRFEPRRKKRRPKPYDRLMKPRHEAKRDMLKGLRVI
jgi:hypothetical protein